MNKGIVKKYKFILIILISLYNLKVIAQAESHVYIFLSFSMPQNSIKEWIEQAQIIQAPVVLRGFVDNSLYKTSLLLKNIFNQAPGSVLVHPVFFRKYAIQKVPAILVLEDQEDSENAAVFYGNISLEFALKQISQLNTPVAYYAQESLNRLLAKSALGRKEQGDLEHRTAVYTPVQEDSSTESTTLLPATVEFFKQSIPLHLKENASSLI